MADPAAAPTPRDDVLLRPGPIDRHDAGRAGAVAARRKVAGVECLPAEPERDDTGQAPRDPAQLAQTLTGRQHSPLVLVTVLGSAAVLAAVIQTPGVSRFFGCTPLGPVAWAGVAASIAVAVAAPPLIPQVERVLLLALARAVTGARTARRRRAPVHP
nr:cation transporting ATPase C-terminal domain-containing protein [Kitasatospora sp. K002]